MAEVLVLVDHLEGEIKKATFELLTAARALGEPSAVVVGAPGTAAKLAERLQEHGAEKIYVAESDDAADFLSPEGGRCWRRWWSGRSPAAVLIAVSADGKEIAGRLAVRTGTGLLGDVVDVAAEGSRRTRSSVARSSRRPSRPPGIPVITLRPGSVEIEAGRSGAGGRGDRRGPGGRGPGGHGHRAASRSSAATVRS